MRLRPIPLLLAALAVPLLASPLLAVAAAPTDPVPEIKRDPVPAQAPGVLHTLRTIPEACARLQGQFSADASQPYRFDVVRTSAACQPRARFVDAAKAKPSTATGWIFNDLIRVPNAACASQQAVVRVWRHPAEVAPPALDSQGRSRIYLKESLQKAKANQLAPVPLYAASMSIEGLPCP